MQTLAAVVCILITVSLGEATSLTHYLRVKQTGTAQEKMQMGMYIFGMGRGFFWANAFLEHTKQPPMYCSPPQLTLTQDNYLRFLDDATVRLKEEMRLVGGQDQDILGYLLLDELRRVFPCKAP